METTKFENDKTDKKGKGVKGMKNGAAMTGAAILGAATATAAEEMIHATEEWSEEELTDAQQEAEIEEAVDVEVEEAEEVEVSVEPAEEQLTTEIPSEPEPIVHTEPASEQPSEPTVHTEPSPAQSPVPPAPPTPEPYEDIVDVIVEEIDPRDIDATDIFTVDEIGTVYTVDGEELIAAAIHDAAGNDLLMIDVDGDQVFDVFVTYEGEVVAEVPGNINVSDAELMQTMATGDVCYLPETPYDHNIDPGSEIQENIIETA